MRQFILCILILGLLPILGCAKLNSAFKKEKPAALVNGEPIAQEELRAELLKRHGKTVLEDLVIDKVISQEFEQKKLKVDETEFKDQLERLMQLYNNRSKIDAGLVSKDEFSDNYRFFYKLRALLLPEIDEEELRAVYQSEPQTFMAVRPQVIFCQDPKALEDLKAKLKTGADFSQLAKQLNPPPLDKLQGDLGFLLPSDNEMKPIYDKALTLSVGEIKDFKLENGDFCLIKLLDKWGSFDQMKFFMEYVMVGNLASKYLGDLKQKATITTMFEVDEGK